MTARFALYFAPRARSAWARFGAGALVGAARRYGFHATLKPPFFLAAGATIADLSAELDAWCATQSTFFMPRLVVERLGDFMAVVTPEPDARIEAVVEQCMQRFERFRAPPDAEESERRRRRPLTRRFHLSLTGPLGSDALPAFSLPSAPLLFDSVCLFEEPARRAPFRELHRAPFRSGGRLVYVAGPSGAGKDTLIAWARRHLHGAAPVMFAQRTITRPAHAGGEMHIAATPAEFAAAEARGDFAMSWQANGHRYGIGAEIREWLAHGLTVVVSGSREYLPQAFGDFPDVEVVLVTAPPELLRTRLLARGREDPAMRAQRLGRRFSIPPARIAAQLVNDGDLAQAGRALLEHLLLYKAASP